MIFVLDITRILLACYIICFAFYNLIAFLISTFYRKKFNQPSPQAGFLVTIFFSVVLIISLFMRYSADETGAIFLIICLFCGSIASSASSIALYFTMKRVRK